MFQAANSGRGAPEMPGRPLRGRGPRRGGWRLMYHLHARELAPADSSEGARLMLAVESSTPTRTQRLDRAGGATEKR